MPDVHIIESLRLSAAWRIEGWQVKGHESFSSGLAWSKLCSVIEKPFIETSPVVTAATATLFKVFGSPAAEVAVATLETAGQPIGNATMKTCVETPLERFPIWNTPGVGHFPPDPAP